MMPYLKIYQAALNAVFATNFKKVPLYWAMLPFSTSHDREAAMIKKQILILLPAN